MLTIVVYYKLFIYKLMSLKKTKWNKTQKQVKDDYKNDQYYAYDNNLSQNYMPKKKKNKRYIEKDAY